MEPYEPQFYRDVHHYPVYKQDGKTPNTDKSYRTNVQRRQMATPETAQWVAREFKADAVFAAPYLGMGEAFDADENSVQQYHVTIDDVNFVAGEIAYYFTTQPEGYDSSDPAQAGRDAGMWPPDLPDDERMRRGKVEADKWIASGLQYKEPDT